MRGQILGTSLALEICCNCSIEFAMPIDFQQKRRDDHITFYCPKGHPQHYTGKTEADRLREQLDAERAQHQQTRAHLNSRVAAEKAAAHGARVKAGIAKAALDRAMKRIGAGVCPCCNRTFKQLAKHMHTKHPELARGQKP